MKPPKFSIAYQKLYKIQSNELNNLNKMCSTKFSYLAISTAPNTIANKLFIRDNSNNELKLEMLTMTA